MAVYNPYDQVIFDDPAYLTDADKAKEQIQEETRGIANIIGQTAGRVAEAITPMETYEQTLAQEEKNKQILQQLGITNQQLSREQMEQAKAAGYEPLTTGQALSKIPGFLYSDLVKGSQKLRQGVDYYDLPQNEQLGVVLGPLDMIDFALVPAVFKKLATLGVKKLGTKASLKDIASDPDIQKQFPQESEQVLSITGGGFVPEGVMRAPDMGGSSGKLSQKEVASLGGKATQEKIRIAKEPSIQKIENFFNENKDKYIGIGVEKFIDDAKKSISFSEQDPVFSKTTSGIRKDIESYAPEIVKQVQSYYTPQFIVREADLSLSSSPLDQFVKKYSDSFFEIVGRRPTQTELQNHIINTGPEEAKDYFAKSGYSKAMAASNPRYKDLIKPRPKTKLIDRVTEIGKTNPEFESNFNIALANLKQSDAKTNTIKNQYNILMKPYTDNNLEKPFSYESFGKYVRGQEDIPTRQKRLDLEDYESPLASKKKQNRNFKRIAKQITNKLSAFNLTGALPRFLKHQYRSMVSPNLRGRMLSGDEYMKKYIDPYVVYKKNNKGKDVVDKKATEEKFRSEYPNFAKWENMEKRIINYDAKLNEFVDRLAIDGQYTELELDRIKSALEPQRSHEYNIDQLLKKNRMINVSENPDLVRVQPKVLNMVYQPVYDSALRKIFNIIEKADSLEQLKTMKPKAIYLPKKNQINANINVDVKDFNNQYDYLDAIYRQIDGAMKARGMVGHYDFNPKNKEILKGFKFDQDDQLGELITVGSKKKFTAEDYLERMEDILNMIGYKKMMGNNFIQFKKGGPVKMAIGGDPLANMNQQQYSPDPAFDDDYFQQAVESGNLQAANLLNLFKVFKKPKVMATPSNVKQVEQARDPMPAPTGSQEIAPLPAGRPDFFFKSYLLDQLNSKNSPKASTPQGWREFLIKGKKVPEAEMADTGILQYLEDTEKFYPDKKITREEIENLYDMSPLGNLEVRVKDSRRTVELDDVPAGENSRDFLDFNADQGRAKHKGAGSADIDNAADEYFEVVVNVPSLPGQEKAFVNSAHFSEPNVLGFTRVGTYKNNAGDKVAVIQEMQTDMLTEVRKEQERLFAMVNNLKRQRAQKVENINRADPSIRGYEENELRMFDQKYPPELLDALETENLIQPFPNIVAKDLIPERTRSLNQIQEDINKLMMGNVEQYADPAYKTKVFDLAQEQNRILEELMSMNRSSNYKEKLQGFKVPSTSDRADLESIAYTQTYTPSGYYMKDLESFPPIPFNKQADYVDLLIKSTIKAAKQKGIDKVAIMPADVGANPRWRKTSDEAKKKFQNLYDKVGVQQLKNIAKKYGGKLEIEKIVDPNKNTRGLTFLNKNPEGEFQILKQTEARSTISDAERDAFYDEEIKRIASGNTEPGDVVLTREIAPGQMMDYYIVEGRGDATDVGYRMIPLKEGESADDAMIKIVEYNPSEVDMYTISFDPSKLEEPMYLFKKKSGGSIDKDSLVSITDIYGEYGR